ncbi:MAG: prenyltransferase [Candidatus Verstraetearchaeota archaeon]|nr:prenyltransferase [Candidatus Verstraetearchaeota archaeon]
MPLRRALSFALRVSRTRFWIYTAGTYVVGYALGMGSWTDFLRPEYAVYLAYFFFPANIFIYGINDYWDEKTDWLNPKKDGTKEHRLGVGERALLARLLWVVAFISLALMAFKGWELRAIFLGFLFLSYFYSAPPLRFKGIPFLDFASNMLYVMPGIFGYYLAAGTLPPLLLVVGGFAHISAMHIFSAVPDVGCDRAAGIRTTPVYVGERNALLICLAFWALLSYLVITLSGFHPLGYLSLVYPALPLIVLASRGLMEKAYWSLPYINWGLGGLLFLMVTLSKV